MYKYTLFQNSIGAKPKIGKQKRPKEADEFEDVFLRILIMHGGKLIHKWMILDT